MLAKRPQHREALSLFQLLGRQRSTWMCFKRTRLGFMFKFGCRNQQQGVKSKTCMKPEVAHLNLVQSNSAGEFTSLILLETLLH